MYVKALQRLAPTAIALFGLALVASRAQAHDSWLYVIGPADGRGAVMVGMNSGMAFPALDHAVLAERLTHATLSCPGAASRAVSPAASTGPLRIEIRCAMPGVVVLNVALEPRTLTLGDDDVAHYLDEIAAPPDVRVRWEAQRGHVAWTETYAKSARLALAIGPDADAVGSAWLAPSGEGYELVPSTPWAAVRSGGEFVLRLLADGRPVEGVAVGMRRARAEHSVMAVTDAEGAARFTLGGAGPVLFHATMLEPAENDAWRSRFATLTFNVDAR